MSEVRADLVGEDEVPVITIDGPSGAGKGAVSARCAAELGFHMLDSGAVYRSVAVAALNREIDAADVAGLLKLCLDINLEFLPGETGTSVHLDGEAVDDQLRREEVSVMSSMIAVQPDIR